MKQLLIFLLLFLGLENISSKDKIKFMVYSDLHYDLTPEAGSRLQSILRQAQKNKVDFIIEIGDLVNALPKNAIVKDILNACPIEQHHVIGNHDVDLTDKQTYMNFVGMSEPYYYFDKGKFRFIILDSNFYMDADSTVKPYNKGVQHKGIKQNMFSPEQLVWLKDVLQDTTHICILFSHHPINDKYNEIEDYKQVHNIILNARNNGTRIAAVLGGHMHSDNYHKINNINYVQVNSASNIWGGSKFINFNRFPEAVYKKYPSLEYTIPYKEPLYAIITINSTGKLSIKGTQSSYIEPAPDENLLKTKPYPCSPIIQNYKLTF